MSDMTTEAEYQTALEASYAAAKRATDTFEAMMRLEPDEVPNAWPEDWQERPIRDLLDLLTDAERADLSAAIRAKKGETTEEAPTPPPSRDPFDPATGLAHVPSDPLTYNVLQALMQADSRGEWTKDHFGRPVYSYTLVGPPWTGHGRLSIIEEVDAAQAWKMLEDADLDAVTLYFLYLAYASDTSRRGGRDDVFRISKDRAFHALGLHRRTDLSAKEKVMRVYELNRYLLNFRVQLHNVRFRGDRIRRTWKTPAQLWDTWLAGVGEEDLFGNPQWQNFWIEGREGAWADAFLHGDHGGRQWTAFPFHVLEDINRRNEWPRRILFHSLLQFRINGGAFTRNVDTLLQWCRAEPSGWSRKTRGRRKTKLLNALEELKEHGFQIDANRAELTNRPFDEWKSARVEIAPTKDMQAMRHMSRSPRLPERSGDAWTGRRVRELRDTLDESQKAFGDRLGISQPTVSTWETGAESVPPQHEEALNALVEQTK